MAENSLLQKGFSEGFDDLFDEDKFKEKQRYANFIFWIALIVEIIAASIGAFFAWSTGFNAYEQIPVEERNDTTKIYAIQGALPFLLIAIIEPLKIPLAGGLYMVSDLRWKFLIFLALMGLTLVTFETMFTSFEQNLTNVNGAVIRQNNLIDKINGKLVNLKIEEKNLNDASEDGVTKKIKEQNNNFNLQSQKELNALNLQTNLALKPLQEMRSQKSVELQDLTTKSDVSVDSQKDNIEKLILSEEQKRERVNIDADKKIKEYRDSLNAGTSSFNKEIETKVKNFREENQNLENSISKLENQISKLNSELSVKLEKIDSELRSRIEQLDAEEKKEIKEIEKNNIFSGSKTAQARESYNNKRQILNLDYENKISSQKNIFLPTIQLKRNTINDKNKSIKSNNDEINKLIKTEIDVKTPDQNKINNINNKRNSDLEKIDKKIDQYQIKLNKLIEKTLGVNNKRILELKSEIKLLDQEITEINKEKLKSEKSIDEIYKKKIAENNERQNSEIKRISENRANRLPTVEKEITKLNDLLEKAREEKRIKSQGNQVYRLAAWWDNVPDIANVTKKQVDFVAGWWYGSIALIAATMGTILAFIHYIMKDRQNYIRQKNRRPVRRLYFGLIIIVRKITKLLWTLIKLLASISRVILSFVEIFRGLIGRPFLRTLRLLGVAIRKRLNKPIIKEKIVEKEVEVVKEVEIIKEIEIEKPVEVIKEVPVEKVVIREVPKEIVRKELRYLPLYSSESGLVDAPKNIKEDKKK